MYVIVVDVHTGNQTPSFVKRNVPLSTVLDFFAKTAGMHMQELEMRIDGHVVAEGATAEVVSLTIDLCDVVSDCADTLTHHSST